LTVGDPSDYIGHIDVVPPLNADEMGYLQAFRESRRFDRVTGPYDVPAVDDDVPSSRWARAADGQPSLWCAWLPCADGCCLTVDSHDASEPADWLRYLVRHFLRPGAVAHRIGGPRFAGFTFDHRLDGLVVGCRRDDQELFAIRAAHNRVSERVLRPGDRRHLDDAGLAAAAVDGGADAPGPNVIDLAARRRR